MIKSVLVFMTFWIACTGCSKESKATRKVVLENEKVKVTEYLSVSGGDVCGDGRHAHPPHLTVLLTDANVRVVLADGRKLNQNARSGTTFSIWFFLNIILQARC